MYNAKDVWISDSCVIIDLFSAGVISHLFSLDYTIKTTDFVVNELISVDESSLKGFDVVITSSEEILDLIEIRNNHPGLSITDISVYYHANKRGWVIITGDGALRKFASEKGILVHGTLWILDEFVEAGCLLPDEAADALNSILNSGGRLPLEECEKIIKKWLE
ncbi:MAG: type II toxin-antitoxin system VapC family toxin [Euryarchaeota archaeon]|nr:type II toxin-antitoxin system VapC family toxin [Euryarchaeota archaeon]